MNISIRNVNINVPDLLKLLLLLTPSHIFVFVGCGTDDTCDFPL